MSKFCGKCGARLDEATGLCPNCDAEALRKLVNQAQRQNDQLSKKEAREQRREAKNAERAAEKAAQKAAKKAAKKARKQQKKAAKKAAKKEKWAAKPWWKKLLSVVLRCVAWLLILAIVAVPVAFVLVRWQIIDIPVVSRILSRTGLEAPVDVELDPTRDNYIPNDASVKFDADANIYYADNELVIIFSTSATEEQIMQAIDSVGGKIAGTIPSLNMYQITIAGSHTLNELLSISQELMERYEYISYASFDSAVVNSGSAYSATPNDPWDKDVNRQDWTDLDVDGSNWWIEAIEAQEAWAYADDFPVINVGISDSSFDIGHEDLKNKSSFPNDILRSRNVVTPWWNDGDSKTWSVSGQTNYHGTHVAGIIGAEHNNKKGISGVAPNCHMFFAPYYRNEQAGTYLWWDTSTYANLAYLVESGAKVINYSQGKTNFLTVNNSQFTTVFLEREGNMAAISMARLLDRGYDFIVVQSAGNGTGDNGTAVDALQNGWFASVTSSSITGLSNVSIDDVRDRIIIVGAAEQNGNGYRCTSFSNYGTQVDIFAPGRNIYSTVPGEVFYGFELWGGYAEASGTSMAAPIVTGVCALTWSANTQLTAAQVKEIVCSNTKDVVVTHPNTPDTSTYNLVNAKLSVEAAKNYSSAASGSSTSGMENDGDFENNRVTSDERDIVLVLDTSGSMSGTPMAETKKASINFIDTILDEDASIGIVTYDYSAYMLSDFSVDANALTTAVSGIYDGGGTDIESGLAQAHAMLGTSNAKKKIIVLMSDGEPNEGKEGQALIDYADEIKDDGVIIYTLGFFESLGSYKSSAQVLMEGIASDGCHYEVASADDLVFFFEDVADQINGQKYIYIRIACPVDVSVSYGGETLDSSRDDLSQRTEFGTLTYEENENALADSDDRIKILRLKEGVEYDVQIVGTGRGVMDYTIGFMDEDGQYSDLREFENIKITKSTVIDTVAEVSDETILRIDEDGDGRYDIKYRAKENGFGEEVGSDLMIFVYIGAASAAILLMVSLIFKLLRRKHRQE